MRYPPLQKLLGVLLAPLLTSMVSSFLIIISETRPEKGCYHHVYRGKDKQWHFADSGIKNRNQDVTVTLPRGRRYYRFEYCFCLLCTPQTVFVGIYRFHDDCPSVRPLFRRSKMLLVSGQ